MSGLILTDVAFKPTERIKSRIHLTSSNVQSYRCTRLSLYHVLSRKIVIHKVHSLLSLLRVERYIICFNDLFTSEILFCTFRRVIYYGNVPGVVKKIQFIKHISKIFFFLHNEKIIFTSLNLFVQQSKYFEIPQIL